MDIVFVKKYLQENLGFADPGKGWELTMSGAKCKTANADWLAGCAAFLCSVGLLTGWAGDTS